MGFSGQGSSFLKLREPAMSRQELSSASGTDWDHLPHPLDQRAEMTIPRRHRVLHRDRVLAFVVNANDTATVTALVVQNLLDHMRLNADVA
jgi:hypothetical protein